MNPLRRTLLAGGLAGLASLTTLSAHADEKGETILREAFRTLYHARSMTADLVMERKMTGQPSPQIAKGTISLKKPNLLRVSITQQSGARTSKRSYVSDGKSYFNYTEGAPFYMRDQVDAAPTQFSGEWEAEVDSFFGGEKNAANVTADYAGTETLDGALCDLVRVKQPQDTRVLTYAIGEKDHLIYRTSWTTKLNEKTSMTQINRLANIKLNGASPSSLFAFTPPQGVKLYDPAEEMRQMEAKLVHVGEEAPAFELTNPQDKTRFSLAKALDGRKAVLVNFWFYG